MHICAGFQLGKSKPGLGCEVRLADDPRINRRLHQLPNTATSNMGSNGNDELEKLKSHLQVYEGMLRDQAAAIASLEAENAYLK